MPDIFDESTGKIEFDVAPKDDWPGANLGVAKPYGWDRRKVKSDEREKIIRLSADDYERHEADIRLFGSGWILVTNGNRGERIAPSRISVKAETIRVQKAEKGQ